MKKSLQQAIPFAEAFARLLHPFAEVVIHDLDKGLIEAIYNPLSQRVVGDDSYLDNIPLEKKQKVIGPYNKTNWDGRPMKSISIILHNQKDKAEGFLCVNVDTSAFHSATQLIDTFLHNHEESKESFEKIFIDDLYEKINLYIQTYCSNKQATVDTLNRSQKKEIISALEIDGAFKGRNAASYIGRILGISRATVYNYLKERNHEVS